MNNPSSLSNHDQFAQWLYSAYSHLYDSPYLQSHPLCDLLVRADIVDPLQRSQAMRRMLLTAIESLRPQPGVPAQSPDWRYYQILEQRYIEALSPVEVMQRLSLSRSQFYRDQSHGFDLLVEQLWRHYQSSFADGRERDAVAQAFTTENETQHLLHSVDWKLIHLAELLENLRPVFEPLIQIHGITLHTQPLYHLPPVQADRVMLRQTLINVLTCALTSSRGRIIEIRPYMDERSVGLCLDYAPQLQAGDVDESQDTPDRLAPAAQFMKVMRGELRAKRNGERQRVALLWPHNREKTLLIVDDNQGLINLFRRYLINEPWRILSASNGREAFALINEVPFSLILLDIMMPEQDGWEVLVELKQHPVAADVPVLICSVVHEAQLADSLGAAGYVTKPVTQEALIAALQPWR
jgi:CheY-like chemotaxis protein